MPQSFVRLAYRETIHCPSCRRAFPLSEGLQTSVVRRLDAESEAHETQLRAELAAEERRKAERSVAAKLAASAKQVAQLTNAAEVKVATLTAERDAALEEMHRAAAVGAEKERAVREKELGSLRQLLESQEAARQAEAAKSREIEAKLRDQLIRAEKARSEAEILARRQLEAERDKIRAESNRLADERSRRAITDLQQKLDVANRATDELKRKLEQGSEQAQGEAGEVALQKFLQESYRFDVFEPVPSGTAGADLLQRVHTPQGEEAGCILWEVKSAHMFRPGWVKKLRADALERKVRLAVLVTSALPREAKRPVIFDEGVLIMSSSVITAFSDLVRELVIRQHRSAQLARTTNAQMAQLLEYVLRGALSERLRSAALTLHELSQQHLQECNYQRKVQARRSGLIQNASDCLNAIRGELMAVLRDPVADERLRLPAIDGDAAPESQPKSQRTATALLEST